MMNDWPKFVRVMRALRDALYFVVPALLIGLSAQVLKRGMGWLSVHWNDWNILFGFSFSWFAVALAIYQTRKLNPPST